MLAALFLGGMLGLALAGSHQNALLGDIFILAVLTIGLAVADMLAARADARIVAAEASYRAFFEHALEGIFRTTPRGYYLDANPALAEIYGYPDADALKAGLTDIAAQLYVAPGRREEFQRQMQAHDKVCDFVSEIRRHDGTLIWISENARAVRDRAGNLVCYEGSVEDVTEKIMAERTLRGALREAEEASRSKAAFLAAMSHELKTPLNAVLGFSEIIRDEVMGTVGVPAYKDYAADIHLSGVRLLSIINDVLDVARIEGGAITMLAKLCDPLDIAREAIALARNTTGDMRDIAIDMPSGLPAIHVDVKRLSQALGNLVANALKFTPEGGQVRLRLWLEKTDGVCLAVEDKGIGMAPEKIAAALEPFRQLDGSLARKFEGAGLGLSIAKSFIQLHGGALSIESAIGKGTVATLALPPSRTRPRLMQAG